MPYSTVGVQFQNVILWLIYKQLPSLVAPLIWTFNHHGTMLTIMEFANVSVSFNSPGSALKRNLWSPGIIIIVTHWIIMDEERNYNLCPQSHCIKMTSNRSSTIHRVHCFTQDGLQKNRLCGKAALTTLWEIGQSCWFLSHRVLHRSTGGLLHFGRGVFLHRKTNRQWHRSAIHTEEWTLQESERICPRTLSEEQVRVLQPEAGQRRTLRHHHGRGQGKI